MWNLLLDLIFPKLCQGCGTEGSYLCLPCQNRILQPVMRCVGCGKNSPLGQTHDYCQREEKHLAGLVVAAEYRDNPIQSLIWHLKYNSVQDISTTLAVVLADFFFRASIQEYFADCVVVPVPMHKKRLRMRGFNQAETIGQAFAEKMHLPFCDALEKIKHTDRQVGLKREPRLENLRGAFRLKTGQENKLSGKKILLLDDVATTGATLSECGKILAQLNPSEIWGLVVARN